MLQISLLLKRGIAHDAHQSILAGVGMASAFKRKIPSETIGLSGR
jgi:hypothetical protein